MGNIQEWRQTLPRLSHPLVNYSDCQGLLDRQFVAERPKQKWIADFTYIWTAEGWLYVAAVIDLFSRGRLVDEGRDDSATLTDVLVMANWRRGKPDALLHHWCHPGAARRDLAPSP
jgi:transposase InsO family protein